jgi:ubiquinone/menaquinone biosynthesis C-methylase UbiE
MMQSLKRLWWRIVQAGFHAFYHRGAFTYDLVSRIVSLNHWKEWQKTALTFLPDAPATILEIAHGTGELQIALHDRGYTVYGVDLSPQMGRITRRKARARSFEPKLVRGDSRKLAFQAASMDGVVCTFPTGFIFQMEVWQEIWRVLRPGCCAALVINAELVGHSPLITILEWAYSVTGQRSGMPDGFLDQVAACGFTVDQVLVEIPDSHVTLLVARKQASNA